MIPLSYPQQQLWLVHRLEGPSATYNIPLAVTLRGPLDTTALAAAYRDLVARHEPLRSRITLADGEPVQVATDPPDAGAALPVVTVAAAQLDAVLAREATRPFDLTAGPPVRATLLAVRSEPELHVLLIVAHHIAADGWSLGPIGRDLSAAYAARLRGRAPD